MILYTKCYKSKTQLNFPIDCTVSDNLGQFSLDHMFYSFKRNNISQDVCELFSIICPISQTSNSPYYQCFPSSKRVVYFCRQYCSNCHCKADNLNFLKLILVQRQPKRNMCWYDQNNIIGLLTKRCVIVRNCSNILISQGERGDQAK